MIRLGGMSARIPGDFRYSDSLEVQLVDPFHVRVVVRSQGAAGGMDAQRGATDPSIAYDATTELPVNPPTAARVLLGSIRSAMKARSEFLFIRYGKPTKLFHWDFGNLYGLSLDRARGVLAQARLELYEEAQDLKGKEVFRRGTNDRGIVDKVGAFGVQVLVRYLGEKARFTASEWLPVAELEMSPHMGALDVLAGL